MTFLYIYTCFSVTFTNSTSTPSPLPFPHPLHFSTLLLLLTPFLFPTSPTFTFVSCMCVCDSVGFTMVVYGVSHPPSPTIREGGSPFLFLTGIDRSSLGEIVCRKSQLLRVQSHVMPRVSSPSLCFPLAPVSVLFLLLPQCVLSLGRGIIKTPHLSLSFILCTLTSYE